jgi:hypothetical protein
MKHDDANAWLAVASRNDLSPTSQFPIFLYSSLYLWHSLVRFGESQHFFFPFIQQLHWQAYNSLLTESHLSRVAHYFPNPRSLGYTTTHSIINFIRTANLNYAIHTNSQRANSSAQR